MGTAALNEVPDECGSFQCVPIELTGIYPSSEKFFFPEFKLLPVSAPCANLGKGELSDQS